MNLLDPQIAEWDLLSLCDIPGLTGKGNRPN